MSLTAALGLLTWVTAWGEGASSARARKSSIRMLPTCSPCSSLTCRVPKRRGDPAVQHPAGMATMFGVAVADAPEDRAPLGVCAEALVSGKV